MRNVEKHSPPEVLIQNKSAWDTAVSENPIDLNKNRYRHIEIKERLLQETFYKCVYCESKIKHNCPGDIEHKIPKSKRLDLIFEWDNMTIACSECNRRKSDYYETTCMFLDPNTDDVEGMLVHTGPFVFSALGHPRAEFTVRLLKLNRLDDRPELVARKLERLELIHNLVERIQSQPPSPLKNILIEMLKEYCGSGNEFSAMVKTHVDAVMPDERANN